MKIFPVRFCTSHSRTLAYGLFAALFLSACASTPQPPSGPLNAARNAIENAEQAQARQHAGAELEEAKQKLALAEKAVEAERMAEAERLALQSRVAAELAIARTGAAKATAINRDMQRSAEALDEEMRRQGDTQ